MKLTTNQLRKIIAEEVKRTISENRMLTRIRDVVGKGDPEDYGTTAYIIQSYMGETGIDPVDIEQELTADLRNFPKPPANPVMAAKKLMKAFGLG